MIKGCGLVVLAFVALLAIPICIGFVGGFFGLVGGLIGGIFGLIGGIIGAVFGFIGWIFKTIFHAFFGWGMDGDGFSFYHGHHLITFVLIVVIIALVVGRKKS